MHAALLLALLFGVIPTKVTLITTSVFIGDRGPYRFVVDTGSQSTMIEPELAEELRLTPEFQVEMVNLHGSHFAPGTHLDSLRSGGRSLGRVEVLFADVPEAKRLDPQVRGVIGANALGAADFLLSASEGRMQTGVMRPEGEAVPFDIVEGRIVVKGRMGKESLSFVLDSGASHMVLFRLPAVMLKTPPVEATVRTLDGARSVAATTWSAELVFSGKLRLPTLPAAVVPRAGAPVDGLLPVAAFQRVFVDQARREVVLVR